MRKINFAFTYLFYKNNRRIFCYPVNMYNMYTYINISYIFILLIICI